MKHEQKTLPLPAATQTVGDNRAVRDILLNIERLVKPQDKQPTAFPTVEKKDRHKSFPARLSQKARDALEIVLDSWRSKGTRGTIHQLTQAVNDLEPATLGKSGDLNRSIHAYCAERMGIEVKWSTPEKG